MPSRGASEQSADFRKFFRAAGHSVTVRFDDVGAAVCGVFTAIFWSRSSFSPAPPIEGTFAISEQPNITVSRGSPWRPLPAAADGGPCVPYDVVGKENARDAVVAVIG